MHAREIQGRLHAWREEESERRGAEERRPPPTHLARVLEEGDHVALVHDAWLLVILTRVVQCGPAPPVLHVHVGAVTHKQLNAGEFGVASGGHQRRGAVLR